MYFLKKIELYQRVVLPGMDNSLKMNLPNYKRIASTVQKRKTLVEEQEVEAALKRIQISRAKFTALNRPCQKGDFVEIEFEYTAVAPIKTPTGNESRKIKDGFILGKGGFLPGFEEKIEGMNSGDEKEFFLPLPEKKEAKTKEVPFKVKMKSVQKVEFPEICDQWAKELGNFKNLKDLRKGIKEGLKKEKEIQESQRVRQELLDKISEGTKAEIPEILIEKEVDYLIFGLKNNILNHLKISFEEYLKKVKKTEKEIRDSFRPEAEKRVKAGLVLRKISEEEKIDVSEQEIKKRADMFLKNFKTPEQTQKKLDPEQLKRYIGEILRNEKTLEMLESLTN